MWLRARLFGRNLALSRISWRGGKKSDAFNRGNGSIIESMRRRYAPAQVPHHLVHRGNDRCCVFQTDEQRISYLSCLSHARWKYQCCIHAYVLMDNHVHLLATAAGHCGISRMMQWLGARYTTTFNESQGRTGTLWEGRFYSSSILSERYFLICQRYIELN